MMPVFSGCARNVLPVCAQVSMGKVARCLYRYVLDG